MNINVVDRNMWLGWNELPTPKEGNTGKYIQYQSFLYNFIRDLNPKHILEIGFNAGHSACCFLNACPNTKMYSFDICRWGTEVLARDVLKKHFDLTLIEGDSTKTIPEFFKQNSISFDFIFIDGGHFEDVPYLDIMNTKNYLSQNGVILIDDLNVGTVNDCIVKSNILNEFNSFTVENIEKQILLFYKK